MGRALAGPLSCALLRADPRIVEALDDDAWDGFDANPRLSRWSGAEEVKDAPWFGEDTPDGLVRLSTLVGSHPLSRKVRV